MQKNDFYRKKNFADPNIFKSAAEKSATAAPQAREVPTKMTENKPKTKANTENETAKSADTNAKAAGNASSDNQERNDEEERSAPGDQQDDAQPEQLIKHPLQNNWTLWYLENDKTKSWEDMQNYITSMDTVEDFWSLYNHIKPPSELKIGSDYSMFKTGIRPMWEDAANKQGGRWVINVPKNAKGDLDNLWLDTLLCLIGETFEHSNEICGAVVNIRPKMNKISIWTASGNHEVANLEIGHKLREVLRLGPSSKLEYQLHKDTMVKQGSSVKSIYTL